MQSTSGHLDVKLADDIWQVICETLSKYDGIDCNLPELKEYIEKNAQITVFNGGVFIADGNEFDLFVLTEKRGKWAIKKEITSFLAKLAEKHTKAVIKINERNQRSLRLAKFFGFERVRQEGLDIVMERAL